MCAVGFGERLREVFFATRGMRGDGFSSGCDPPSVAAWRAGTSWCWPAPATPGAGSGQDAFPGGEECLGR
ncbi:hypothetical protein GCM10010236_56470 [Streptomyces eurythermus]|nr:hypothetical protein GCM10010236_56470 [Streptomyces eurythermus]